MNIYIKKKILIYKGYKLKCSLGKFGTTSSKKEGDLATPKGIFDIGALYYRKDRIQLPKCKLIKKIIKKNMGWCDDVKSKLYNKEIRFPFKYKAEKLYIKNNIYDLIINIKYNQKPIIKGKGSAIFLHIAKKKYKPTKGCIAIKKNDFLKILPLINKKTKIIVS
tara:strand:- start:2310 stop:2801 length:492 start_codon:yes stop_codon:yes gene_type:complete